MTGSAGYSKWNRSTGTWEPLDYAPKIVKSYPVKKCLEWPNFSTTMTIIFVGIPIFALIWIGVATVITRCLELLGG